MGYGSTSFNVTTTAPIVTLKERFRWHLQLPRNMFTYLFGPVVKIPTKGLPRLPKCSSGDQTATVMRTSARRLLQVADHLSNWNAAPVYYGSWRRLDFHISKNFSVRPIELDYVLTRYTNPFTNTNNQNNFRYTAGAVFRFSLGHGVPCQKLGDC